MNAPFSSNDMATFVSPILGAAVAIPAAIRCSERAACAALFVMLNIVNGEEKMKVEGQVSALAPIGDNIPDQ